MTAMHHLRGFSLIEMMVALFIGALIVLMVGQVYVMSSQNALSQQNVADAINQQVFAFDGMMANLRLAGLGIDGSVLTQATPSGILIHAKQLDGQNKSGENLSAYLTASRFIKNAHTNLPSDQLTITYRAPQDMWSCEGEMVLGPRRVRLKSGEMVDVDGQVVIERYFVQNDDGVMNLHCDSAKFIVQNIARDGTRDRRFGQSSTSFMSAIIDDDAKRTKSANVIYGFGGQGGGQIIAHHVEGMWVRFGVQTTDGIKLMASGDYDATLALPIVSIDLALLTHSSSLINDKDDGVNEQSFAIFDKTARLTNHAPKGDRQLHQMSIELRNAQSGIND
ncbi:MULTISPECIES: PilW family protein [unclassified Moraxella]|uniref:PilW family protein n=1 Tax=unclassified Moraxella TaxID=2685852 RepID=UPI002B401999|nr:MULTISPECIES: prepilin-type N-terminal cleavage/methylation domain-containing protein [unclassified Moraxella]